MQSSISSASPTFHYLMTLRIVWWLQYLSVEMNAEGILQLYTCLIIDLPWTKFNKGKPLSFQFTTCHIQLGLPFAVSVWLSIMQGKMLDMVFVVHNPIEWHRENISRNPSHYSFLRVFGPKAVSWIQRLPAAVYYNTLVKIDSQVWHHTYTRADQVGVIGWLWTYLEHYVVAQK